MKAAPTTHARRLVLLFWILVGIFYFYLSYDYLRIERSDAKFHDELQHIVQVAGDENRNSKDIRSLVLVRADELSLPVRGDQITILGGGVTLNIAVSYDVDVDTRIFSQGFYKKHYDHKVTYRQSN